MGVTAGLFDAIGVILPDVVTRLFFAGGGGMIAVLAAALVVMPGVEPALRREKPSPSGRKPVCEPRPR